MKKIFYGVLILILSTIFIPFLNNESAYAQTDLYVYVDDLPEWGEFASNAMYESTQYWQNQIPDLQFYVVDDPAKADFRVQWVKEFGVEHVGFAFGSQFMEVGLGDSNCGGNWNPFSANYVADIVKHEIGHILGYTHSDDPNDIMYPVATNYEYGLVEQDIPFVENYAYFIPVCSSKSVTSFNYNVSTDDPSYGFDVYFVPDVNSLNQWSKNEAFEHYAESSCNGQNYLSFGGVCESVSNNSGLLIFTHDTLTNPLTTITVQYQEVTSKINYDGANLSKSNVINNDYNITDSVKIFVDPQQRYTITYPSTWIVDDSIVENNQQQPSFYDFVDWQSSIHVLFYEDIDYTNYSDDGIINGIIDFEKKICSDLTFSQDDQICYGFEVVNFATITSNSGKVTYNVEYTTTRQYSDPTSSGEYDVVTTITELQDGNDVWAIITVSDGLAFEQYSSLLQTSVESFSLIKSSSSSSETVVDSIPIPQESEPVSDEVILTTDIGFVKVEHSVYEIAYSDIIYVKISGVAHDTRKGDKVALTYTFPDGTTNGNLVFPTKQGNFEALLTLDKNSPKGTYEVFTSFKNKILGIVTFKVVERQLTQHPSESTSSPPPPPPPQDIKNSPTLDFVDPVIDPFYYVDRYNSEKSYKDWFDDNYSDYTIYQAVGLKNPLTFVDTEKKPQYYIDRYHNESKFRKWFVNNYPNYTIYEAIGVREPLSEIPAWVKSNAQLWSNNFIDDETFLSGIQYMIEKRIIVLGNFSDSVSMFDGKYTIRGGIVENIMIDNDILSLVAIINSDKDDGTFTIDIPRNSLDAKTDDGCKGIDEMYFVFVDSEEVLYQEIDSTDTHRTLSVEFKKGTNSIEIIGTCVIPEISKNPHIVPSEVKTNAKLWYDGVLDDESFLNDIKSLIKKGIIAG